MSISENNIVHFSSMAIAPEYKLLQLLFSDFTSERTVQGYRDIIDEIEEIERGEINESPEPWALTDSFDNEFTIKKETTFFKVLSAAGGWEYLEMPTAEFKDLLLKWIRFKEINKAAFSTGH